MAPQPLPQDVLYQDFGKDLYRLTGDEATDSILDMLTPDSSANNSSSVTMSASDISSGVSSSTTQTATGSLQSGKSTFDNSVAGYVLGVDPKDGKAKFFIGNATNFFNWDGTNITLSGNLTLGAGFSIKGGQTDYNTGVGFFIGFSGTTPVFSVGDGTMAGSLLFNGTSLSVGTPALTLTLTADENIAANAAVSVSLVGVTNVNQTTNNSSTPLIVATAGSDRVAQTFTTTSTTNAIVSVTVTASWPNIAVNDVLNCAIYNVSGNLPTGAAIATAPTVTLTGAAGQNNVPVTFTFSSIVPVNPSTQYAFSFWLAHADFTTNIQWSTSDVYIGGQACLSSDSGATWTAKPSNDLVLSNIEVRDAHIVNASSAANNFRANAFLGFSPSAILSGASGPIILDGFVSGFTGLSPASTYFLNDTNGTIGNSAGSVSRKVGVAISATKLLIKYDNP